MISDAARDTLARMRASKDESTERARVPSEWVLDAIAERKLTGGWNVIPENICPVCHCARPVQGVCCY
jgi:hypothetical protein